MSKIFRSIELPLLLLFVSATKNRPSPTFATDTLVLVLLNMLLHMLLRRVSRHLRMTQGLRCLQKTICAPLFEFVLGIVKKRCNLSKETRLDLAYWENSFDG